MLNGEGVWGFPLSTGELVEKPYWLTIFSVCVWLAACDAAYFPSRIYHVYAAGKTIAEAPAIWYSTNIYFCAERRANCGRESFERTDFNFDPDSDWLRTHEARAAEYGIQKVFDGFCDLFCPAV